MRKSFIVAIVLGILLPWLLSYLFLTFLTGLDWTKLDQGALQPLALLSFASVAFSYNAPIFGYGYTIPLIIWLLTGLLCGLFSKSVKRGVLITILGLLIHIVIFATLTAMNPAYIPGAFQTSQNSGLLGGFSVDFFISLGIFLFWYSLVFPGSILGGIMGGLVSRSSVPA